MADDGEMINEAPAQPVLKKRQYYTPTVVDYGHISKIALSGASGGLMDGANMSSMCSGNCS